MKKLVLLFCTVWIIGSLPAQIGGDEVFEFLHLSHTARVTGLGGNLITVQDDDIGLAMANPAALNPSMDKALSFNHNFHLGGIQNGYAAAGWYVPGWKTTVQAGMQYVSYGTMNETDIFGDVIGEFKAADYAFTLGAGRQLYDRVTVGANMRFINSRFANFDSWGLAFDLGIMYYDTARDVTLTMVARNAGWQLNAYRDTQEPMPFDLQIGFSKKLEHLPFRFSVIYHHLDQWNILYDDPNTEEDLLFFGEEPTETGSPMIDNFFRHFVFNGEFLLGKQENLRLRVGYNHQRAREMKVANYRSMAGFSLGFGLKISKFRIDYGHSFYHLAGGINHFTISTNLNAFGTRSILD